MPVTLQASTASAGSFGGSSTVTFSLNMGTDANRLCLVGANRYDTQLTSVSCGGVAMNIVATSGVHRLYYRIGAGTGAQNIVLTASNYTGYFYSAASFSGVDQTTPLESAVVGASTSGAASTGSITCPSGGLIYASGRNNYTSSSSYSAGSGCTLRGSFRDGGSGFGVFAVTRDTTGVPSANLPQSVAWNMLAVPINESTAPRWTRVGSWGGGAVASGDVTVSLPAGTEEGDLIVAMIAYRSNVGFSLPSGWAVCAPTRNTGNAQLTGGIASGLMAYIVRGASAPDMVFTRSGGDVAVGLCVAYRAGGSIEVDANNSVTSPSATYEPTLTGITTTTNNELLVFFTSGARATDITLFRSDTSPTTSSGTGTDSGPIESNAWKRQQYIWSSLGADVGGSFADAIKATAGNTGTLRSTITATATHQHVLMATSFKAADVVAGSFSHQRKFPQSILNF